MPELAIPSAAKDLIPRLPRTFAPALNAQLKGWELLFPAEQRQLNTQLDWLARLSPPEFERLFAPVVQIEQKMELPRWNAQSAGLSVQDVGLLARSPFYPQWRAQVETVFARIDEGSRKGAAQAVINRLVVCILPPGLPISTEALWPELQTSGRWTQLDRRFGELLPAFASTLAKRTSAKLQPIENTWAFECDTRLTAALESPQATIVSWAALAAVRREFLNRLNALSRTLDSVDQTIAHLRRMDIDGIVTPRIGANLKIREFVRNLLLSGNGSLVFNNSFVQWGASEALRRVQPQILFASFGIRPKLKPFSSTVLFEDQTRSNPVQDEDDPAGSFTDARMLASYVHLAALRVASPQSRVLTLMTACDLDRLLIIGEHAPPTSGSMNPEQLTAFARAWIDHEA